MSVEIGLGLLLNILFWTVAVLAAVALASLAVIEYFPGRKGRGRKGSREGSGAPPARAERGAAHGSGERYRKAS